MIFALAAQTVAAPPPAWPANAASGGMDLTRGLFAVMVVFGLLGLLAWLAKRGMLGGLSRQGRGPIKVETAFALGERRSLAIVTVEGRRLLVGMTPMHVSLVTELGPAPAPASPTSSSTGPSATFQDTLARSVASPSSTTASSSTLPRS